MLLQVSSKIGVIESLIEKVDKIILGGGMIFTFFKARGLEVGSSLVEEDKLELAKTLEEAAKKKGELCFVGTGCLDVCQGSKINLQFTEPSLSKMDLHEPGATKDAVCGRAGNMHKQHSVL